VKFFASREMLNKYNTQVGTFPPRGDAIGATDIWNTDPLLAGFAEQLKTAMPRGPHPRWPEISNAMSEALQKVLVGVATPQAAMDEAQAKVEKVLR
jgi:multiple sugar transport system substrate-binding protein